MNKMFDLTGRVALARMGSRGFHLREDYPSRDDKNWLKGIIIQQIEGSMKLLTEPIPIGSYKIRPTQ